MAQEPGKQKDFFISYTGRDSSWAEWIAFELEAAGYSTIIQAWDMRPGSNFVVEMDEAAQQAERTLLVLSTAYQTSEYTHIEWAAALRSDPSGKKKRVLPVRIEACDVEGLLGPIVYIDLVKQEEEQARERLLAGVKRERANPLYVAFPVDHTTSIRYTSYTRTSRRFQTHFRQFGMCHIRVTCSLQAERKYWHN